MKNCLCTYMYVFVYLIAGEYYILVTDITLMYNKSTMLML